MRIFIITQSEPFYLPKFFEKFLRLIKNDDIEIIGVNILKPFDNDRSWLVSLIKYYKYLGLKEFFILGCEYFFYMLGNFFQIKYFISVKKIPTFSIKKINSVEFQKQLDCDLLVSVACPLIIDKIIIDYPKYGCINFHAGYLPKYRGINPSFWVLLNEEKFSAITIHKMDEKIDNGPIIKQEVFKIENNETLYSLLKKISKNGPSVLVEAIKMVKNDILLINNDINESSYYGFPTREDGENFRSKGLKFR